MARRASDDPRDGFARARAYPRVLRWASGALLVASGLALAFVIARALLATEPVTPAGLLRLYLAFSALPAIAAWLVQRALAAEIEVDRRALQVRVGGQRFDVPLASIVAVEPWRVPLPQAGFDLRLASGERFALGIGADDPGALIEQIVAGGAAFASHPTLLYARVKHRAGRLGTRRLVAKFPLFAALVAGVLFSEHQRVAYGGPFGQYELDGALPYARAFAGYWLTVTALLVAYASAWRWLVEPVAWLGASGGETIATRTRQLVELACRIAYYAGVTLLLATRFGE